MYYVEPISPFWQPQDKHITCNGNLFLLYVHAVLVGVCAWHFSGKILLVSDVLSCCCNCVLVNCWTRRYDRKIIREKACLLWVGATNMSYWALCTSWGLLQQKRNRHITLKYYSSWSVCSAMWTCLYVNVTDLWCTLNWLSSALHCYWGWHHHCGKHRFYLFLQTCLESDKFIPF